MQVPNSLCGEAVFPQEKANGCGEGFSRRGSTRLLGKSHAHAHTDTHLQTLVLGVPQPPTEVRASQSQNWHLGLIILDWGNCWNSERLDGSPKWHAIKSQSLSGSHSTNMLYHLLCIEHYYRHCQLADFYWTPIRCQYYRYKREPDRPSLCGGDRK